MTVASTEEIRSHFPALNRQHNGQAVAYFDGPGGTQHMMDEVQRRTGRVEWIDTRTLGP